MFVDFSKAFDSVNRKAMLYILLNYGIPEEIVNAIAIMYDKPSSFVQTLDGPTKEFFTTTGILQGETLAPYLFECWSGRSRPHDLPRNSPMLN